MAQQNNPTNLYIQDANGRQMIKVVTGDNSMQEIIGTLASGQQIKLLKTVNGQTVTQTLPQAQLLKSQKIITKNLPVGTMAHTVQKTSDVQLPKTLRLTQINRPTDLKIIQTTQKISLPLQTPSRVVSAKAFHTSPPILDHSGNRKRMDAMDNVDCVPEMKRRKIEKAEKGLRHFSMKVCEKVRKKKFTTYNEVADELVTEYTTQNPEKYDQKNIRRRVYDALNVLMAMGIISKQKKDITWIGLPSNSVQECIQLEQERKKKLQSIAEKRKYLLELITNLISFKNLVERNRELESVYGRPPANSCIELPFIVVKTNKNTVIDCSISQDKMEYLFHFNDKFEIHDDSEVLKQMGMLMGLDDGTCDSKALEKLKSLVPSTLQEYVTQIANGELNRLGAGPSMLSDECIDASTLDEITSHQSSSPALEDYSDEDMDSDMSDVGDT